MEKLVREVSLDFSKCSSQEELHQELSGKFCFPEYYGNNLDALWDCLTDLGPEPICAVVTAAPCPQTAGQEVMAYYEKILRTMEEASEKLEWFSLKISEGREEDSQKLWKNRRAEL